MSEKKLNLHQKLVEIRKQVKYLQKDVDSFKFKYAKGSTLIALLRPKMDELGVLLDFEITELETHDIIRNVYVKKTNSFVNKEIGRVKMKFIFTLTNADDPEQQIKKTLIFQGLGDDIQDIGGYHTYATRYFLLGFFNIPSDKDDPDTHEKSVERSQPVELISDEQIKEIDSMINGYDSIRNRMIAKYGSIEAIHSNLYDKVVGAIKTLISDQVEKA